MLKAGLHCFSQAKKTADVTSKLMGESILNGLQ